jgi:hypothetical protein
MMTADGSIISFEFARTHGLTRLRRRKYSRIWYCGDFMSFSTNPFLLGRSVEKIGAREVGPGKKTF